MEYKEFRYYYPPRPKANFPPERLQEFDKGKYLAQPKLNGSCCLIFTNGKEVHVYNRHKSILNFKISNEELLALYSGKGWMVLLGEYMNKACKDESGKLWNHKYCIFDILVYNGKYLLKSTIGERQEILGSIFKSKSDKKLLRRISENVYIVQNIELGFKEIFDEITKYDMYEGLVLKNKSSKLIMGLKEKSDISSQIKCRKPTKNYSY